MVAQVHLSILVDCHTLLDDHSYCHLHIPIQQVSRLLGGLFTNQQRTVSINSKVLYKFVYTIILFSQKDLGLDVYDNDAFILFKELLTPTFFIIITIIQVHFVHKDFLEISDLDNILNQLENPTNNFSSSTTEQANPVSSNDSSFDQIAVKIDVELKSQQSQSEISSLQTVISKKPFKYNVETSPKSGPGSTLSLNESKNESQKLSFFKEMRQVLQKCFNYIYDTLNKCMVVIWRIMELHILKVVFLCAVLISIKDVSSTQIKLNFHIIHNSIFRYLL